MGGVRTPELDAAVRARYVTGVIGKNRVAGEFGIGPTTVRRIVKDDAWNNHARAVSRDAKRRRRGVCEGCGGETRYGGGPGVGVSRLCVSCASEQRGEALRGAGPGQRRILGFVGDRQVRFSEIRDGLELTDGLVSNSLHRLVRYGLLRRVRRGVYERP